MCSAASAETLNVCLLLKYLSSIMVNSVNTHQTAAAISIAIITHQNSRLDHHYEALDTLPP